MWWTMPEAGEQQGEGATVRHLGQHHGGSGDDVVAYRNLFAVVRSA